MNSQLRSQEVLGAIRDQLAILQELELLVEQQRAALMQTDIQNLGALAEPMSGQLEVLENAAGAVRQLVCDTGCQSIDELGESWAQEDRDALQDVRARIGETVARLLTQGGVNKALASRGLLLARYSLRILNPERYRPYGNHRPGLHSGTLLPAMYSRRG